MTVIIEKNLIANSISETIKGSLNSLSQNINILERTYTLEINEELFKQLILDYLRLTKQLQKQFTEQQNYNLDFQNQKLFLTNSLTIIINFFDRYSEFWGQQAKIELEKCKRFYDTLVQIIEGLEIIDNSQKNNEGVQFLEQIYEGVDLLVDAIETNGVDLPTNFISIIKVILLPLPVTINNIYSDYPPPKNQEQKLVRKYLRQIDRALNSGISVINDIISDRQSQLLVKSEEELIQAQIESNFVAMQFIEFLLKEDQNRVLTKEERQETQDLMDIIDAHRHRKLFS